MLPVPRKYLFCNETLDELTCIPHRSEFFEGEIIAFVECLEILSDWDGFEKFFKGNVEDKYPVK